jgi:hypothetical protein
MDKQKFQPRETAPRPTRLESSELDFPLPILTLTTFDIS